MDIYDFQPGDHIMRVNPSRANDRSFMGNECVLKGVYSGVIFITIRLLPDPIPLPCDHWQHGWELFPVEINPQPESPWDSAVSGFHS